MTAVQRQRARRAAMIRERLSAPMISALKHGSNSHLEGLLRVRPHDEESLKRELQKKRIIPLDGSCHHTLLSSLS
jgi:hypothetical protein